MKSGGNTAFLSVFFCIFVIFSKHNVECADHQCNFWRKRDVAVYNWWGFLKVFLYLPILFYRNIFIFFQPYSWKLLFLVIFSIFIFVLLLFETFFKIVASYLSLFKLINSLTVEVSGILITIAGEEKTSPKYPMKLAVLTPLSARRKLMYCGYIPTYF